MPEVDPVPIDSAVKVLVEEARLFRVGGKKCAVFEDLV
jgi:hypothetical protein